MGTVLVADDAQFMRNLYRVLLAETSTEVVADAANGHEAVQAYEEHDPDIVVMNVRMPILDGIAATEDITELDPDARIIICSGIRQEAKMKEAIQAGAFDYVTKPFQRTHFLAAIDEALQ